MKKKNKKPINKKEISSNKNIETNANRINTTSTNENLLTTTSGSIEFKKKESAKTNIKRETIKKK